MTKLFSFHFVSRVLFAACMMMFMTLMVGCTKQTTSSEAPNTETPEVQSIKIDGSSTVYPLTEAVAEEYQAQHQEVRITVGVSGTGGGMKKFIGKEIDITGASRTIKESEIEEAQAQQVNYKELTVAFDGISVVVHPENDFLKTLTTKELIDIWKTGSDIQTWKDLNPAYPDEEIKLFGPGTDSGTFDYFTETLLGEVGAIRADFTASENDNVLVQGVSGNKYALGFFGFAYYLENKDKLKLIPIDNGNGPIEPNHDTIKDGSYEPLSRPIYIYVNQTSLDKPRIREFVEFYLDNASLLAEEVGYVALDDKTLNAQKAKLQ